MNNNNNTIFLRILLLIFTLLKHHSILCISSSPSSPPPSSPLPSSSEQQQLAPSPPSYHHIIHDHDNEYTKFNDRILLHIVPHTHDDAGWLNTVDQYYNGNYTFFGECVRCILSNMIELLDANTTTKRIFTYVEMIFFEKWYHLQDEQIKQKIKDYVKTGRLTFPNGGWVMNDEACTYYDDIIEQMILGHRFLKNEFNYIPDIGWHIDPFGHSSTQADLFSQMGFKMFFIERVDYQDIDQRGSNQNFEFIWKPEKSLPENYIATHINRISYAHWYRDYHGDITDFIKYYRDDHRYFKTNNSICLFGDDFGFSRNADQFYTELESIINQINNNRYSNIKAILSSPSDYANHWYTDYTNNKEIKLHIKRDDFFPMADKYPNTELAYWTGYYTNKPHIKIHIKISNQNLNNFRKIYAKYMLKAQDNGDNTRLNELFNHVDHNLEILERAIGLSQHHDAISGTSKAFVAQNYSQMMLEGSRANLELLNTMIILEDISSTYQESSNIEFRICHSNATSYQCNEIFQELYSNKAVFVRIFNPGKGRKLYIKLKIPDINVDLINTDNDLILNDKICYNDERYYYSNSNTKENRLDCDLYFQDYFYEYEFKDYKIIRTSPESPSTGETRARGGNQQQQQEGQAQNTIIYATPKINPDEISMAEFKRKTINIDSRTNFTIDEDFTHYELSFCRNSNMNIEIHPDDCIKQEFTLDYLYYKSIESYSQNSGAYIFRPHSSNTYHLKKPHKFMITQGKILTEIRIERGDEDNNNSVELISRLRLYKDNIEYGIEVDTHILPMLWNSFTSRIKGKELIIRIKSLSIDNKNIFYTDSNGMFMNQRVFNYKSDYDNDAVGNIATGNYYPITSAIYIDDTDTYDRLTVMNDRAQGGSSLHQGEIELMLYRRILTDDNRGVNEVVDDKELFINANGTPTFDPISVRTIHIVQFSNQMKNLRSFQRQVQYNKDNTPLILYGISKTSTFSYKEGKNSTLSKGNRLNNSDDSKPQGGDNPIYGNDTSSKDHSNPSRGTNKAHEDANNLTGYANTTHNDPNQPLHADNLPYDQCNTTDNDEPQGEAQGSNKQPHEDDDLEDMIKVSIRSYAPREYIIRLHNLDDEKVREVELVEDGTFENKILSKFLDNERVVITKEIEELSLSTNQLKSKVLENKLKYREIKNLHLADLITQMLANTQELSQISGNSPTAPRTLSAVYGLYDSLSQQSTVLSALGLLGLFTLLKIMDAKRRKHLSRAHHVSPNGDDSNHANREAQTA